MSMLINLARAKSGLQGVGTDQDPAITDLIASASVAVEAYCHRTFALTSLDELYDLDDSGELILRQRPLVSVDRVSVSPDVVLSVTNADRTNARATVSVSATGLTLTRIAGGVATVDGTPTYAANPSLTAVAAAVNALGHGWLATVQASYGSWASSDLGVFPGTRGCLGKTADLRTFTVDLDSFDPDYPAGILRLTGFSAYGSFGFGWGPGDALDFTTADYGGTRSRSARVQYSAGFATVPEDVQHACAIFVQYLYQDLIHDNFVSSESLDRYSVSYFQGTGIPEDVKILLAPHKRILLNGG
jgi:hypothetical protein